MSYKLLPFDVRGDDKGWLVALEGNKELPFDIKRIFYIYDTQGDAVRGRHANRNSEFVLVAIHGQCKVKVKLPEGDEVIVLDSPDKGLWLDKMVWKEMYDFSKGAVLLVLSNEVYDKNEYIYDYEELKQEIGK